METCNDRLGVNEKSNIIENLGSPLGGKRIQLKLKRLVALKRHFVNFLETTATQTRVYHCIILNLALLISGGLYASLRMMYLIRLNFGKLH